MDDLTLTDDDLRQYVDAAGETPRIDHKASIEWDGKATSASLAKDIMACANTHGGGVIVIGVEEVQSGVFNRTGVEAQQVGTFETTRVAAWVNARCEPKIELTCYRVDHHNTEFVVIAVRQFTECPVICTKDAEYGGKKRLRKGAIYVRGPGAESAPLQCADDVRRLIGAAVAAKQHELTAHLHAVLAGAPVQPATPADAYEAEAAEFREVANGHDVGAWEMRFYCAEYSSGRFRNEELRDVCASGIGAASFSIAALDNGVVYQHDRMTAAIARSGYCLIRVTYFEDERDFVDKWVTPSRESRPAGEWVEFLQTLRRVIRIFAIAARLSDRLDPAVEIVYEASASNLKGRHLLSEHPDLDIDFATPCRAPQFTERAQMSAGAFAAAWRDICSELLHRFFGLMDDRITRETIGKWVSKLTQVS